MKHQAPLMAVGLILLIAGCGSLAGPVGDLGGNWLLERGTNGGQPIPIVAGSRITMTIEGSEIGGTAACNIYGGTIDVADGRVSIGALSMTEMACQEDVMASEAAYLAALARVESATRSANGLILSGPQVELRFALVPPVPDAALVGNAWVLDSLITRDAVSSTLGKEATLELGDDGTLSGSTGCRDFTGRYTISGDEVQVPELVTDDRACQADLAAQDDHVLSVIADGFTVQIEGDRLTLTATRGGLGLSYLAAAG